MTNEGKGEYHRWRPYARKGTTEMRPYLAGEDLTGVSVGANDTPEPGGMIARNPADHADMWYVAERYFDEHMEPAAA